MKVEILIQNGNIIYEPIVTEGIQLELERKGVPGKLTFSVLKDEAINFQEGNPVAFKVDSNKIFYGFVFSKNRDKNNNIEVTAYDQIRYLKNKNDYQYSNKTASEVVKIIASNYKLNLGDIDDTGYKIASRVEAKKSLIEIILNALDLTVESTGKLYVLYDDFGKLTLKNIENMKIDRGLLICDDSAEDFNYSSSIDGETYNQIKLQRKNSQTGELETCIVKDEKNIEKWGILQYYEELDTGNTAMKPKADALFKLYNQKSRALTVNNAFGDIRVRGGSSVPVNLDLGDIITQNYMVVEKVTHNFDHDLHLMDLTLKGGLVNA